MNLEESVSLAADQVLGIVPDIRDWEQINKFFAILQISRDNELFEKIKKCDSVKEAQKNLSGLWLTVCGTGSGVNTSDLEVQLVVQKLAGIGPTDYLEELNSLTGAIDASGVYFFAIWGISIDSSVTLSKGVNLLPWSAVPDCAQKKSCSI
jgi:hypothetical protein